MPALDFAGLTQAVIDLSPTQISSTTAQKAVNRVYQSILRARPGGGAWFGLWKSTVFCSSPDKTAGSVTLTSGSTTVVGTGTSWDSGDIRRYLVVGGRQPLRIADVTDATHLDLAQSWCEPTLGPTSYQVMSLRYTLPTDCDRVLRLIGPTWFVQRRNLGLIDAYDPRRSQRGEPLIFNEVELIQATSVSAANATVLSGTEPVTAGAFSSLISVAAATSGYQVVVEPSWSTTTDVPLATKLTTGFTVVYNIPPPPGGQVDWVVIVPGSSAGATIAATQIEMELWPIPDADMTFALHYRKRVADLVNDSDLPVIAPELVLWQALAEQSMKLYSRTGEETYLNQAKVYQGSADKVLDSVLREDRRMRGSHPQVLDIEDAVLTDSPAFLGALRVWQTLGLSHLASP